MEITIILILILICIIGFLSYKLNQHTKEENEIQYRNKQILKENNELENKQNILKNQITELNYQLSCASDSTQKIKEISRNSLEDYSKLLEKTYEQKEEEYNESVELLKKSYGEIQDVYLKRIDWHKQELDKIAQTRAAAIQAQLKEEEIKQEKAFYCPQIAEDNLKDVKILKDIEYKLNNPRILRMLIWSTYYQKPMNQVCANVLGGATIVKRGIYKITNQLNNMCYIGQSVDVATRWKNHAKAGLGIDTPAGNKLYKAMMQDGLENFSFELLEEIGGDLNEKEKFYINLYQANEYGYNSVNGHD